MRKTLFLAIRSIPLKNLLIIFTVKKLVLVIVMIGLLVQQHRAYSQALPVAPAANFVMNRAVGGVLTRVAISRGFAANDPRIAATLVGASSSLTAVNVASTVAGVAVAVAGAPVWLSVAAGLGVLAVGAAIVAGASSIAISNSGSGNKLQIVDGSVITPPAYQAATTVPINFSTLVSDGYEIYRHASCFSTDACFAFPPLPATDIPIRWEQSRSGSGTVVIVFWSLESFKAKWTPWGRPPGVPFNGGCFTSTNLSTATWTSGPNWDFSQTGKRLVGNLSLTFQNPPGATPAAPLNAAFESTSWLILSPNFGPQQYANLDNALANISTSTRAQILSADTLARISDQAWKNAASQPGYQGLPYSVTQPVTAAEVSTWQGENPASMPTIGDLLAPANAPGTSTVPISPTVTVNNPNPSPSPNPNPNPNPTPDPNAIYNVNIVNTPKVDLGADPGIRAPTLETTPSAGYILVPLLTLFPELSNYQTPQHVGVCPKPEFAIFGKTIVMESHCTIAEQYRQTIAVVMLTVWVLVGLLIILTA